MRWMMFKRLKRHKSDPTPDAFAEDVKARLLEWGEPSEAARARIWQRVLAASKTETKAPFPARRRHVRRSLRYAAFAFVMLLSFLGGYVGVVLAEGDSLPGEPFYPLERTAEAVLLSLTPQTRRCAMELRLLESRVYEIRAMLDIGRPLPDSLIQETMLLVSGLPETLQSVPAQCDAVVIALESHHDALITLDARHPGVWALTELIEAFETTIDQLRDVS